MTKIELIKKKITKLLKIIELFQKGTYENKDLKDMAVMAEKLFLEIRMLAAENYIYEPDGYNELTTGIDVITISEDDCGMKFDMPIFVPFKKLKSIRLAKKPKKNQYIEVFEKCNAILGCLDAALRQYIATYQLDRNRYSNVVLEYTNYFEKGSNKHHIPDADNIEFKQVTDLVIGYISNADDSFDNVDFIFKTRTGDRTHTVLRVIPKEAYIYA